MVEGGGWRVRMERVARSWWVGFAGDGEGDDSQRGRRGWLNSLTAQQLNGMDGTAGPVSEAPRHPHSQVGLLRIWNL